jgi:hypothetical protein
VNRALFVTWMVVACGLLAIGVTSGNRKEMRVCVSLGGVLLLAWLATLLYLANGPWGTP